MQTFNYQELADHFESSLLTTLRAHSAASELFEFWVPDADIVQSIINMVDNFDFEESPGFRLLVQQSNLDDSQIKKIEDLLLSEVTFSFEAEGEFTALTFHI